MNYTLKILRRERDGKESFWQCFLYIPKTDNDTVATALTELNKRENLTDADGNPTRSVEWECSCLQKKCGACAMVISGRPCLACDAKLTDLKKEITVEPLRKFPVVCDLVVDRSILYENLKTLKLWLKEDAVLPDRYRDLAYEASECIQCGCCLEVCPNFDPDGIFTGAAGAVPMTRLLLAQEKSGDLENAGLYEKRFFESCGKSLACEKICPAGIPTGEMLSRSNAVAVWKRNIVRGK